MAGYEITVNLIGNALVTLARHPAQLEKLRQGLELMPRVVEEFLRLDYPFNLFFRGPKALNLAWTPASWPKLADIPPAGCRTSPPPRRS